MAPELGLFLDECVYEAYNMQYSDLHEPLRLSLYAERVAAFKAAHLYPHIESRDVAEGVNAAWLAELTEERYKFSQWPAMMLTPRAPGGGAGNRNGTGGRKREWAPRDGGVRSWLEDKRSRQSSGDRGRGGGGGGNGGDGDGSHGGGGGGGGGRMPAAVRAAMDAELSE
jgi:hypothetical protein